MDLFNSKQVLSEKRWLWIDYDKGISIILVGYGHCLSILGGHVPDLNNYVAFNYVGSFLFGFRMPLFFIVSGLLVGKSLHKKGLSNYIINRANNILFPLLVWGIIEISIQLFAARY
ncbi:MAG: acyltransferase, partial [Bacteroidota bacterium]|nr:acyltransferase [Bacteroidota bacterium]